MPKTKKFSELRAKMSPESQERAAQEAKRMLAEMPLARLREARHMTQSTLANALEMDQSEISRIEHRTDVYVSTLASYIEAMGGELEIRAVFPDSGAVRIKQFATGGE